MSYINLLQTTIDTASEAFSNEITNVEQVETFFNKINLKFCQRLIIDILGITILIFGIHKAKHKNSENAITFMMFNVIIFLISIVLKSTEMSMGAAFGLFAVFSMLRYRTEDISMIEMTYLFLSISIGIISAIGKSHWSNTLFYVSTILLVLFILEFLLFKTRIKYMNIQYENIENIHKNKQELIINDLKEKLGLEVVSFKIVKLDLVNETATLVILFHDKS